VTSDYRKRSYAKKGSTINIKVLGGTANLPYGLQAYGKDCVGDKARASKDGYFAYLAAPAKGKAVFVHEEKTKEKGTVFKMWEGSKTKDAPPGRTGVSKKGAAKPGEVERKIASMQKTIASSAKQNIVSHTTLKGRWSGYIECPSGRVILTRDISNFTTLALVSNPAKRNWSWAIHIKDLKSTHWFTKASKKTGPGVKSISLTGSKGTLKAAFNEATEKLWKMIAQATLIKGTVRRAAVDLTYRNKRKAGTAKRAGDPQSPLTKSEWKRFEKLAASGVTTGAIGRELARLAKKAAQPAKKKPAAKAKPKNGRRKAAQTAAPATTKDATKAQKALKGKYVTFNVHAGAQLKGKVGYVKAIGPNGRKNYATKSGGAKLYVLAVNAKGNVSNRLKAGMMEYKKGKRTFSVKGKGTFNKWMKVHADKKGALHAVDLVREVYLSAEKVLGKRIVNASQGGKPAKKKPANGRRGPRKPKTATTATAKPRPTNGRRKAARAARATATTGSSKPATPYKRRTRRTMSHTTPVSTPSKPPKASKKEAAEFAFF